MQKTIYNKIDELKVDLLILEILRQELTKQNIWYINFIKLLETNEEIETYDKDFVIQRIFLNIWKWNISIYEEKDINGLQIKCNNEWIDISKIINWDEIICTNYYKYFLEIKINTNWINEIDTIKKLIDEEIYKNSFINKSKELIKRLLWYKWAVTTAITWILIIGTFMFDIKFSKIINEIPLLWSIINTEILEEFENINEKDEYYSNLSWSILNNETQIKWTQVSNIKVKTISENQKIFQIQTNERKIYMTIKKENGQFYIKTENWNFRPILWNTIRTNINNTNTIIKDKNIITKDRNNIEESRLPIRENLAPKETIRY